MTVLGLIAGREPPPEPSSIRRAVAELVADIELLLGTLRGSMPGDVDFGVGDVTGTYASGAEAVRAWCLETQEALRRYVPRLRHPRVIPVSGDALDLVFRAKIHGSLIVEGRAAPLELELTVDPQRSWRVR
ncbi:GPW/gp25 family protein [Pendulispora brunnea]|uniref:GPW/gp25 family protein n=1 Tax=Pendulispora brunnea TaxID=2905690 RepID=A0ABZ2KH58_9BACT